MSLPLIATKLQIPALRPDVIRRSHLITRLHAGLSGKLSLISAPAGFGKTTLVQSWLESVERSVAWISLDDDDNDPARFLAYLVSALQMIDGTIGTAVADALQAPQHPSPREIFIRLINDITLVETPFILVLDDLHVIDEKLLLNNIDLLVANQPFSMHLVLITREDPPLPLAKLRARGQMVEIRAGDLRFRPKETTAFLNDTMGIGLNGDEVALVERRTEGWIAGLQLAAISMQQEKDRNAFIKSFSGSHRFVLDYLTSEALTHLSEEIRMFLLQTGLLERLTASLCDAVTGRDDSQALLGQIEEMNLFLIRLDQERRWYRYHHLFAEVLQKQLHQHYPDEVAQLHGRASAWYETAGSIPEAIHHASAANDIDRWAALVETHTLNVIKRGQIHLARKWIEALPVSVRADRPRINMNYGWALFLSGNFAPLPEILDQIEGGAAEAGDLLGEASTLRAFLSINNPGQMQEYALHALDIVPDDNRMVHGLAHMGLANVHLLLQEKDKAFAQFAQAAPLHWAAGNRVAAMMAVLDLMMVNQALRRWRRARQLIKEMLDRARRSDALADPATGLAFIGAGWAALHQNRLDEAVAMVTRGLALAESGGYHSAVIGRFLLAQSFALQGEMAEARRMLALVAAKMDDLPETLQSAFTLFLAQGYLMLDDIQEAEQWLRRRMLPRDEPYRQLTAVRLTWQKASAAQPDAGYREVLSRLSEFIDYVAPRGWNGYLIEAYNLRALAYNALGDAEAALEILQQAIALAEPEREIYAFAREGPAMRTLLAQLPETSFIHTLLNAFDTMPHEEKGEFTHPDLTEPLSEREVEVLQLLAEGLTYKDIAERLVISVNTVRYHIKGLYGKLGVSSRADAIAKAQALGLLPAP